MKKFFPLLLACCLGFVGQARADAPIILSQPQSLTINDGSTATFTVVATNAISYQWQFQGAAIASATNATLTLEDVSSNQAGAYTVVVSSSDTPLPSTPAQLTLLQGTIVRLTLSGLTNGGSETVNVELFDHDKPLTVQNFLHYIVAGAYTNMFFDRCLAGFVLQGGDYDASDRTNTAPPITGWNIQAQFTYNANEQPPFSKGVTNEYSYGPVVHNRFGTIAMAKASGNPNSATSAFFFNLADNSTNLDNQNGGFTVFGAVIDGTNQLQYFNGLSNNAGLITNAEFLTVGTTNISQPSESVPVNYVGTNLPANANLVFGDFQILNVPTNTPTISITSPASGVVVTNGSVVVVTGTVSDPTTVSLVTVQLVPLTESDGTSPNYGEPIGGSAVGTTNFTKAFDNTTPPGRYTLTVTATDEFGNVSQQTQPLTITALVINGQGTIDLSLEGSGDVTYSINDSNPVGYPYQNYGLFFPYLYVLAATPAPGQAFLDWTEGTNVSHNQTVNVSFTTGTFLTLNFITNAIPNAIDFTYPTNNQVMSNGTFTITGDILGLPSAQVTVRIFDTNTMLEIGAPVTMNVTTSWSLAVTNLAAGPYTVQAEVTSPSGLTGVITENFEVLEFASLHLVIVGNGTVTNIFDGEYLHLGEQYTAHAIPKRGSLFYTWSDGTSTSLNPVETFVLTSNLTLTATFVTDSVPTGLTFTYPKANAQLTNGTFTVTGKMSPRDAATTVMVQVFSQTTGLEVGAPLFATGTANWATTNQTQLAPGLYTIKAVTVGSDTGTTLIAENFSILAPLKVVTIGSGTTSLPNGDYLQVGTRYTIRATAKPGSVFYTWQNGAVVSVNPLETFTMEPGLTLTATFFTNDLTHGIAFTYPRANAILTTNTFNLTGTIAAGSTVTQITCQVFLQSASVPAPQIATIHGSTWSLSLTNITQGKYTVVAAAYDTLGRSTLISENFTINLFPVVAGTYNGLFINSTGPVGPTNSGFLTLVIAPNGVFSGRLYFPAYGATYIAFTLDANGQTGLGSSDFHGAPIGILLNLDLTNGTDTLTGTIANNGVWQANLICYRAVSSLSTNNPAVAGKYSASLEPQSPTNGLDANGDLTATITRTGTVALAGWLPDDTSFAQAVGISKTGVWPLYAIPTGDKTQGFVLGWETNNAATNSGQLYWWKSSHVGAYFTNGIDTVLTSSGATYTPPAVGSSYSLIFQGGAVTAQTIALTVNHAGQFVPVTVDAADKLRFVLSANGALTGQIEGTNGKPATIEGSFINPAKGGSGFTAGGGQIGSFTLQKQ